MKLENLVNIVNSFLTNVLSELSSPSQKLMDAMKYSLLEGGKRLRPVMLLAAYLDVSKKTMFDDEMKYLIFAIEALHSYTLVHDDLPCLDNDKTRRGKPTSHIKFGEATALLAGDALLNASFESFIKAIKIQPKLIYAADYFYSLAGAGSLISGQSLEFVLENFDENVLINIFTHKTAALFKSAAYIGGALGLVAQSELDLKSPILKDLENFALNYGLAFQLKDDLDDLNAKGYAARFGVHKAKELFDEYKLKAIRIVQKYDFQLLTALIQNLN